MAGLEDYQKSVADDIRVLLINYEVTDIIRYSVGVGSWGTRCYLALLTGKDGSHLVLQIKEALPLRYNLSALTVEESQAQGKGEGKRIITAQRVLQTYHDPFLGAIEAGGRSFYVRQFRDMKDSIDPLNLDQESFSAYCNMCAFIFWPLPLPKPDSADDLRLCPQAKRAGHGPGSLGRQVCRPDGRRLYLLCQIPARRGR